MKYPRIKSLREDRACTKKQIADYLGVNERTYSNYENGKTRMPTISFIKLADYYETSVDYLLGHTDTPIPHKRKHIV